MTSVILCIFIAGYILIALEGWTKVNKSAAVSYTHLTLPTKSLV